jgi:hypothetical protein
MRVNAAILASLTGAAFAYPVLDSYKEVKEVPAYGADPQAHAYTAPPVYEDKPAHKSHTSAPKPKQEKPKETPVKQKQAVDDCISKRSALGLDFSACTKGGFSGSLGGSKPAAASKASAAKALADLPDPTEPKEPFEPLEPTKIGNTTDTSRPLNALELAQITRILRDPNVTSVLGNPLGLINPSRVLNGNEIAQVTRILNEPDVLRFLSSPTDVLPLEEISKDRTDQEITDSGVKLPIGTNLNQLLPSGESDAATPESDPVSAVTNAAQQLQKSGFLPKRFVREVRPQFTADGTTKSDLSGNASADEESTAFDLAGSVSTAATGSASLAEREVSDDVEKSSLTGFLLPTAKVDDASDSASDSPLAPLGLSGSLTGAVKGDASASSVPVKRTVLLDDDSESASLTGNAAANAKGKLSSEATADAQSDDLTDADASTAASLGLAGNFAGKFAGSANAAKRQAASPSPLSLDAVTALLAPLTGSKAPAAGGAAPAKRQAASPSPLSLDAVTALLAPLTGSKAPAAGGAAPAKRQAASPSPLSLDAVTALLAPLTGSKAPAAGGAAPAKRQAASPSPLSLDAVTALLAPLTGSKAPAAGGAAPAKRQAAAAPSPLSLDAVTALLAPLTGSKAPAAGGAPAKRDDDLPSVDSAFLSDFQSAFEGQLDGQLTTSTSTAADSEAADETDEEMMKRQLGLDAITGLLAPVTGAPAPAGAPAKRN